MNEGEVADPGRAARPAAVAESAMVARDLELCALTGARYHVAHVSTAGSVALVREAKRRGLPVTCEVTPHHLTLTDEACAGYDTLAKCNPPLRDRRPTSRRCARRWPTAPSTPSPPITPPTRRWRRTSSSSNAAFGMIGLETALPLCLDLVRAGLLTPPALVALLTSRRRRCFGLPGGTLAAGAPADVTVIDPSVAGL